MKITQEQRLKLEEKLDNEWILPMHLFGVLGDVCVDIHDFEEYNYVHFIDNVGSLTELREGLQHLSPLADEALTVAANMDDEEFYRFKTDLKHEREGYSEMPEKYLPLVIPPKFILATLLADKYQVSLGLVLIRTIEVEPESSIVLPGEGGHAK